MEKLTNIHLQKNTWSQFVASSLSYTSEQVSRILHPHVPHVTFTWCLWV